MAYLNLTLHVSYQMIPLSNYFAHMSRRLQQNVVISRLLFFLLRLLMASARLLLHSKQCKTLSTPTYVFMAHHHLDNVTLHHTVTKEDHAPVHRIKTTNVTDIEDLIVVVLMVDTIMGYGNRVMNRDIYHSHSRSDSRKRYDRSRDRYSNRDNTQHSADKCDYQTHIPNRHEMAQRPQALVGTFKLGHLWPIKWPNRTNNLPFT